MSVIFERLPLDKAPWDTLDEYPDRTLFQTRPWLEFIRECQGAEPLVLRVLEDSNCVGYFTGATVRKMGVRLLGSPFPGWTTMYMGFNVRDGGTPLPFLDSLRSYVFSELGCWHLEMMDRHLFNPDALPDAFEYQNQDTYELDLTPDEDELFKNFDKSCRRRVRKSRRKGVVIEEATDDQFAVDYYEQLRDVFAKQGLVPTYPINRVKSLIKHLRPTGNLLLLRAREPHGLCIGTAIFVAFNNMAHFWGSASWREHQHLSPNEPLAWYGIRYWKERGFDLLDFGGGSSYKEKYGVRSIDIPWIRTSRYKLLEKGRNLARKMHGKAQKLKGRLKKLKGD